MAQVASFPEQTESSTAGNDRIVTFSWESPAVDLPGERQQTIDEAEERLLAFFEARLAELPDGEREQRVAEITAIQVRGGTART